MKINYSFLNFLFIAAFSMTACKLCSKWSWQPNLKGAKSLPRFSKKSLAKNTGLLEALEFRQKCLSNAQKVSDPVFRRKVN